MVHTHTYIHTHVHTCHLHKQVGTSNTPVVSTYNTTIHSFICCLEITDSMSGYSNGQLFWCKAEICTLKPPLYHYPFRPVIIWDSKLTSQLNILSKNTITNWNSNIAITNWCTSDVNLTRWSCVRRSTHIIFEKHICSNQMLYIYTIFSKSGPDVYFFHATQWLGWRNKYVGNLYRSLFNTRAVRYHLEFAYHNTIVKVSWYTLGIDTSNEHMIYDNQAIEHLKFGTLYVKI